MKTRNRRLAAGAMSVLAVTATLTTGGASFSTASAKPPFQHVLLISVDGLHASDVTQCIADGLCPNIAAFAGHGTTYANASTSEPSDSTPGLMAMMTGATPALTGAYYDDAYARNLYTPAAQTATGTQNCTGTPGVATTYEESLDTNAPSVANGEVGTRTIMNEKLDPTQFAYGIVNGKCVPIAPNDFLRTNSIFSVVSAAGLRTAWADKHPAADNQVAGNGTPNAVTDPFMTEINADIIPPTLKDTRGNVVTFPENSVTTSGASITDNVVDTESYDQIKVDAVLNEIDGLNSAGKKQVGMPALLGMNFQAVSVGQKLIDPTLSCPRSNNAPTCDPNYVPGGYEPGTLKFTPQLAGAVHWVDSALGAMVAELKSQGQLNSTQIIITAKHGQSPINVSKLALIGHAEDTVLTNAGINIANTTDDDVSLIWLQDQSQTAAAVAALKASMKNGNPARIQYILSGKSLIARFDNPLSDPRTPDIIIQPIPGTIYSTSKAKVSEHGGFSTDDTHVALITVSGANLAKTGAGHTGSVVTNDVTTYQVAPTVLAALGLDVKALDSVQIQHVTVLPRPFNS